jgi:hypothetical protein
MWYKPGVAVGRPASEVVMTKIVRIEIPVDEAAAKTLEDADRRARIGRLVSQIARLYEGPDPLAVVLERTAKIAQASGLTDAEIDAELAAYNAEGRH